jgi:hypothetical protein
MRESQEQETALFDQPDGADIVQDIMRRDMERANRTKGHSLRDLGRDAVEAELRGMRIQDQLPGVSMRLRATVVTKSPKWCEVSLELSVHPGEWWLLEGPTLVARREDRTAESRSLYAISLFKRLMDENGVQYELDRGNLRLGEADVEEWSWWAHLRGPLSVAVQVRDDGSVRVVGLK